MTTITEDDVRSALRAVEVANRGGNVVDLGMLSGLVVKGSNVGFAIEVDPKEGATMEPLRRACEQVVRGLPGITSVTAVLTAERSPSAGGGSPASPMARGAEPSASPAQPAQAEPPSAKPLVPGVRHIVAVASGKGGVGKSTTAVNLAMGLAAIGRNVGLLDADIYGPSLPRMMGITGKPQTEAGGKKLKPMRNFGVQVMSMGFLVDEDAPMIWRGPMVQSAIQQMLGDVAWDDLDVLVVDLPPGTGDAQLTMAQRVPLTGAVIVSTPQDIALLDAKKAINMFRKVDVPILGIVENMSYFCCPSCGHRTDIFSHGGARDTAEKFGVDFLAEVPLDPVIRELSDDGRPIVVSQPNGPQAQVYMGLAQSVDAKVSNASPKPFPRIVYH